MITKIMERVKIQLWNPGPYHVSAREGIRSKIFVIVCCCCYRISNHLAIRTLVVLEKL